ncbi:MAG: cytochrome P450 [Actinomycetota bacterium]|jgi:cytochrome P450
MPTRIEDVPAHLIVDYDCHDPALASDIYARLDEIREKYPVAYSTAHGGYWIVSRYADVHDIARNFDAFSNYPVGIPHVERPGKYIPLETDPPEHTEWRQLLGPLFNPNRMNALEPKIREMATELIDRFIAQDTVEFISAFAHPLPSLLFLELMGWPLSDEPQISKWTDEVLTAHPGASEEENMMVRMTAAMEVIRYFVELIEARKVDPGDDFATFLLKSQFRGRPLENEEMINILFILMLGGLHTVRGTLGFSMLEMTRRPEVRQRLIDDPSLIPSALEEFLRFEAVVSTGRTVVKPFKLHDVEFQPGDRVLLSNPAACRDPREFPNPDEVIVDRNPNRHLAFSAGPHRCIGSHLARIELKVALEELLRRMPNFSLDPENPPKLHHGQVRGFESLHLKLR